MRGSHPLSRGEKTWKGGEQAEGCRVGWSARAKPGDLRKSPSSRHRGCPVNICALRPGSASLKAKSGRGRAWGNGTDDAAARAPSHRWPGHASAAVDEAQAPEETERNPQWVGLHRELSIHQQLVQSCQRDRGEKWKSKSKGNSWVELKQSLASKGKLHELAKQRRAFIPYFPSAGRCPATPWEAEPQQA